jgi:NAD(P)H-hydrate repair Nnr-like enzyme with NAD(P)H-hydrate dehydratase domain
MVRLVSAAPAVAVVRLLWPESVITVTGQDIPAGEDVRAAGRVQAWVVGPGMGTDDEAAERLAEVLASDVPVLVDADGLTLLAARKELLARDAPTLLTPHAGELGRLLDADPADVESRRLEHARKAAASLGATVLLKGSTTVIAAPDGRSAASQGGAGAGGREAGASRAGAEAGRGTASEGDGGQDEQPVWVNLTGTSWLATAGTGDVLSGLAGSLLAQGLEVGEAAAAAAYLHGLAARLAAAGAGSRPVPAVEPSGDGWDLSNPEESRAGYPEAPIAAADVVGALPDAIRSARRRTG